MITEIPTELLITENELAAKSSVSPEEIRVLFQGERRHRIFSTRRDVWTAAERLAKLQMGMENV